MKEMQSSSIALFWNDSLAEELQRFLTGRLKCPEAAADITHETFLRLYENVKGNPPNNARALAFRIAVNLAIDYQRKIKVRNSFVADAESVVDADTIPAATAGPEQIVMAQQRLGILKASLSELPLDCRTAFLLHSVNGLTYSEISKRLGISQSMVNKHLSRAIAHCTQRLDESE